MFLDNKIRVHLKTSYKGNSQGFNLDLTIGLFVETIRNTSSISNCTNMNCTDIKVTEI